MSTIDPDLPVQGVPYNAAPIRENFQAAIADIDALESLNAGDSPPAAPVIGTLWLNTSAGTTYSLEIWNDRQSQWVTIAYLDSLESLWISPVGGGLPVSLLADDTTDLGSYPQTVETITGSGPIYSFGTTAPAGIVKVLTFDGTTQIIYNATSMILPGLADLTTDAGSMGIAVALGSGNWKILYYQTNTLLPAQGGTGRTSLTAHSVLLGEGTSPVNFAVPGTTGYALLSTGASGDPAFDRVNLTVGVTGILPTPNGGTGLAAITAHYLIVGNGSSAATLLAPGTLGYPLVSRGATLDPYYAVLTPTGGGTGLAAITAHNLIIGNGSSIPTLLPPSATSGLPLISQGAAADPAYGVTVVVGGGTGLAAITAHNLLIGNGTSPPTLLPPSATSGLPLVSQGAAADPAYGVTAVAGGGTGLATITAHAVMLGAGTGNVALAAPGTSGLPLVSTGAGSDPAFAALALGGLPAIADNTVLGNVSGGAAAPIALSKTQLTTLINPFSSSLSGAAPASGGGSTNFLRADGTWASPSTSGGALAMAYAAFIANAVIIIPAASITVIFCGGGGAGGDGLADMSLPVGGSGGGNAGSVIYQLTGLTPGNTLNVTIGAGGTAMGAGGNTILASGSQTITSATAGGGGSGHTSPGGIGRIGGGAAGVSSGGIASTYLFDGAVGAPGFSVPGFIGVEGQGGSISCGGFGTYGNGGNGGTADTVTANPGGDGVGGICVVMWLQ